MFGLIADCGLGAMAYSPLAVGLLSGEYKSGEPPSSNSIWGSERLGDYAKATSEAVGESMTTLFDVANTLGKTPAQVAIEWILSHDEITCTISGADTADQTDDVIGSVRWELPDKMRDRLDGVSARDASGPITHAYPGRAHPIQKTRPHPHTNSDETG